MAMAGSSPAGPHKNLIVGTSPRDHRDLQKDVAQADAFSLFESDVECFGTTVFARACPRQVKMELWISAIFATFSMTYDRPALHF
jgi:hypothetical protein